MPLEGRDRELFVKCMGMTTSAHDGEALAALRKANGILARLKMTWADVLSPAPAQPVWRPAGSSPFEDMQRATREAQEATRDFSAGMDDLARRAQRNREKHRADARARTDDQVRRASITATFDLLLKSERLPPLKRDYFQQLHERWRHDQKLSMPEEEQLKRAYAVWG